MLKFFFESKNISNFVNIQIVWFLHISLRNNYNNKFLWMSKKKLFIFHVSEERRAEEKKKKRSQQRRSEVVTAHRGTGRGIRWTGDRNACPNSHVATFQNSRKGEREGIECTPLRSRTVTFSTLTSAKHISALFAVREWMAQIKKRFLKFPHENNSLPFPIYISSSIPVPLICTQTRFPEQLQRISTDESRRAASIMGITCLKRVLHDVYLGSFKRAAWFNLGI